MNFSDGSKLKMISDVEKLGYKVTLRIGHAGSYEASASTVDNGLWFKLVQQTQREFVGKIFLIKPIADVSEMIRSRPDIYTDHGVSGIFETKHSLPTDESAGSCD